MKRTSYAVKISQHVKDRVQQFCKAKGIKQGHFVEEALREKLEEEENLEDIRDLKRLRDHEALAIPLEEYLRGRHVPS